MNNFECLNVKMFFNKNLGKSQRYTGFTLAEVLITLGIIGVVASLTIPSLMSNYQKVAEVAALKKAYAEVTEALKLMANDHGCPDDLQCTGVFKDAGDPDKNQLQLGNEFKKYFKLAKDCGLAYEAGDDSARCMADSYSQNYDGTGDRTDMNNDFVSYYSFITADGFSIALCSNTGFNCDDDIIHNPNLDESKVCGSVIIDVNGRKGPNNVGRDIYEFSIANGRGPALYPSGGSYDGLEGPWVDGSGTPQSCTSGSSDSVIGWTCTGRIMEEGWQMKY